MGDTQDSRKRAIAATSYGEVLDATKHQDDKIGRIVTAVSFLIAASLTLANMSGITITRRFVVDGAERPLLAYAVAGFVLGVVATVVLLLGSLTTGLTLPGRPRSGPRDRESLLYFHSIVKHGDLDTWRRRWDASADDLERDLYGDYVDETFNIARRANHKYLRTNEAAAVLSFTLFCLGAAVVLACGVAATRPADGAPVPLGTALRWSLGLYVVAYTAALILISRRDEWLQRDRIDPDVARERARELGVLQVVAPLVAGALVLAGSWPVRQAVLVFVVLGTVAVVAATRSTASLTERKSLLLVLVVAAVALVAPDDGWRLLAAAGVPAVLVLREITEIARRVRPATPRDPPQTDATV
ncbi:MAG TPA: hypothetical protein VNQ77_14045 [Frankiaceae bacterium]|nr:hypothetical protein [Frankiaceae bacterium]